MWLLILVFVTASRQEIWPPAVLNDYYTEQECQVHLAKPAPLADGGAAYRYCIPFTSEHDIKANQEPPIERL